MKYSKELLGNHHVYERTFCLISYKKWKKIRPGRFWKYRLVSELVMYPRSYMDTNIKTVYKICKRFQKRYGLHTNDFYTRISKSFSEKARQEYLTKST